MKRWALLSGNAAANVVEQDDEPTVGGTWVDVTGQHVGPGMVRDGDGWKTPAPPAPVVSMRQARLALLKAGKLSAVQAAIDAMPSPHKGVAAIEWEYSTEVRRDGPLVVQLTPALGLTDAQMDDLFALAGTL